MLLHVLIHVVKVMPFICHGELSTELYLPIVPHIHYANAGIIEKNVRKGSKQERLP